MRIVLDANILIAAMLGSRGTITIITSQNHSFYVPIKILEEIRNHKKEILRWTGQSDAEFEDSLDALMAFVRVIEYSEYESAMNESVKTMGMKHDAHYLACAITQSANLIWSNDKDFKMQNIIPVKNTTQFIETQKVNPT